MDRTGLVWRVVAALIYFLMLWPVVRLFSRLENRALAGR
jgi:polar amino acid transport system permease protein